MNYLFFKNSYQHLDSLSKRGLVKIVDTVLFN